MKKVQFSAGNVGEKVKFKDQGTVTVNSCLESKVKYKHSHKTFLCGSYIRIHQTLQ